MFTVMIDRPEHKLAETEQAQQLKNEVTVLPAQAGQLPWYGTPKGIERKENL